MNTVWKILIGIVVVIAILVAVSLALPKKQLDISIVSGVDKPEYKYSLDIKANSYDKIEIILNGASRVYPLTPDSLAMPPYVFKVPAEGADPSDWLEITISTLDENDQLIYKLKDNMKINVDVKLLLANGTTQPISNKTYDTLSTKKSLF